MDYIVDNDVYNNDNDDFEYCAGQTEDDWDTGCSSYYKTAPFYDAAQFDAPTGWYAYSFELCDGEQVVLLACSNACRRLDWKKEPKHPAPKKIDNDPKKINNYRP